MTAQRPPRVPQAQATEALCPCPVVFHHRSPLGRNWSEPDNGLPKDRLTANPAGYTRHNGAFKEAVAKLCSCENMPDVIIAYGI